MQKIRLGFMSLLLSLWLGSASAENLVIYPLNSQDALLGVALADQLTEAFAEQGLDVVGPAVSPSLAPPIVVEGGYFNLLRFADDIDSELGSDMLRGLLGADKVLTGRIDFVNNQLEARFFLATPEGVERFMVTAPEGDPSRLVRSSVARLAVRLGLERPVLDMDVDLSTAYADYIQAVALVGFGDIIEAMNILEQAPQDDKVQARIDSLLADLQAVQVGAAGSNAGLMATASLNNVPVDENLSIDYFKTFAEESSLPVAEAWVATLHSSQEDEITADAFAVAADLYPFAAAAEAAFLSVSESSDAYKDLSSNDFTSLLARALTAQAREDSDTEKAALRKITELKPSYVYPFERLSFIAFDEDDALSAAQAMAIATRLEPESDLYWTNLGWSYYLLNLLDQSEEASMTAVELNSQQNIGYFNLGLARVVQGRLDEAMDAYAEAIALDPEVDDEAIVDLVNALELYPREASIHYALASLYEQENRREEAAEQFEQYLVRGATAPFDRFARERITVLRAPPAAIEISPDASFGLGNDLIETDSLQAGDRLYSSFELFTPDAELPSSVSASLRLKLEEDVLAEASQDIEIPSNAIGYVIDGLSLDLPTDLAAGNYILELAVAASEDRLAQSSFPLNVEGQASFLRQLISRSIIMQDLDTGAPLYAPQDIARPDDFLVQQLLTELNNTAEAAEEALPRPEAGRFAGMSGGEFFTSSTADDMRDFLTFFLESNGGEASFAFVDAYAQWALEDAE